MCNPQLAIAGASAALQFQVANAQQKAIQEQQKRQNEKYIETKMTSMVMKN